MATLVLLQGGQGVRHQLTAERCIIGRHPDCTIQLESNAVSRRHAQIVREGDDYYLEDLGSGNGTFLNGQRLAERASLKHEDRIKFGPLLARFESSQPAATSAEADPLGRTIAGIDFDNDESAGSTILGSTSGASGFGVLQVRPEAKLKAVLEISRNLAGSIDLSAMLPKVLDTLFSIFPHADRGCILLKDEKSGQMIPRAIKHRREQEDASVKLSRTIITKVLTEKTGILSADAASDSQFDMSASISELSIRSMMCVPLLGLDEEPTGIINIDTQNALNQFTKDDLELLVAIAGQAALSYETARLMVTYMEKQKQDREMRIARNVQEALLPETLPEVDGYQFYASYDSAQAVGGDYYDAIMLDDDHICLSFGDVAGKGVPGALIMSRIASCVQNTMNFVHDVEKAIGAINNHMCAKMVEGRFVTYLLAVINVKTHEMSLSMAGHMSPMIRKPDGTIEEFSDNFIGLPIGVVEDFPYQVVTRTLNPGEIVVFFTDGVDEAMNPQSELYTLARMREFIGKTQGSAAELGQALLADVRRHASGRPQNDDITIMTFGRDA